MPPESRAAFRQGPHWGTLSYFLSSDTVDLFKEIKPSSGVQPQRTAEHVAAEWGQSLGHRWATSPHWETGRESKLFPSKPWPRSCPRLFCLQSTRKPVTYGHCVPWRRGQLWPMEDLIWEVTLVCLSQVANLKLLPKNRSEDLNFLCLRLKYLSTGTRSLLIKELS